MARRIPPLDPRLICREVKVTNSSIVPSRCHCSKARLTTDTQIAAVVKQTTVVL